MVMVRCVGDWAAVLVAECAGHRQINRCGSGQALRRGAANASASWALSVPLRLPQQRRNTPASDRHHLRISMRARLGQAR